MSIQVQCPHCLDIRNLKDSASASMGKKIKCHKCEEPYVLKPYRQRAEDVEEDVDYYEDAEESSEDDEPPRRSRQQSQSSRGRGRKNAAKKAVSTGPWKVIGSVAGSVLVVVLIILKVVLRARNHQVADVPPAINQPAPMVAPVQTGPAAGTGIAGGPAANAGLAPNSTNTGATASDAESVAFARQFEIRINARDMSPFQANVNWDRLLERSLAGLELSPQFRAGVMQGAKSAIAKGMESEISKALGEGGHYRFLRVHSVGMEKRILFRMATAEDGLNYHDLIMSRGSSGQLEVIDFHVAITGELMSETLHGLFITMAMSQKGSFLQKLTGKLDDMEKHLPTMNQFTAQKNAGQFAEALATFNRLPPSLRSQKAIAMSRVLVASNVNEAEYMAAMSDFRQAFPNDACTEFMSIDFYILRKEFDKCLEAINRIDQTIGGDPYLNLKRVSPYVSLGKHPEARRAIDLVIQSEPTLAAPVYALADMGLTSGKFDIVLEALKILKDKHSIQFNDLRTVPGYAEFVKSPQYQDWLRISQ